MDRLIKNMINKKQKILKIVKESDKPISIKEIARKMHYKQHLVEGWIFNLNAERKITVDTTLGDIGNYIISIYNPKKDN